MNKPIKWIIFSFIFLAGTNFLFSSASSKQLKDYCPFCPEGVLDVQKFYEDELVVALYTHKPVFPGHSLIIPKRHVERFEELNEEEILQIYQVIKKVNHAAEKTFGTSSYLILQKNGKEVGQQVPHLHFHYIPRKAGDDSTLKFLYKIYISAYSSPITTSEMYEAVESMKAAIAD